MDKWLQMVADIQNTICNRRVITKNMKKKFWRTRASQPAPKGAWNVDTRLAVSRRPHTFPGAADRRPHPVRRPHSLRPPRPAPPPAAPPSLARPTAALTPCGDGQPPPARRPPPSPAHSTGAPTRAAVCK